jgi:hypothetical protein
MLLEEMLWLLTNFHLLRMLQLITVQLSFQNKTPSSLSIEDDGNHSMTAMISS